MRISELAIGDVKTITQFLDEQLGSKLLCMGVLPGSEVKLIRKTNFSKTYYLLVGNNRFAIRATEADKILVQ